MTDSVRKGRARRKRRKERQLASDSVIRIVGAVEFFRMQRDYWAERARELQKEEERRQREEILRKAEAKR